MFVQWSVEGDMQLERLLRGLWDGQGWKDKFEGHLFTVNIKSHETASGE